MVSPEVGDQHQAVVFASSAGKSLWGPGSILCCPWSKFRPLGLSMFFASQACPCRTQGLVWGVLIMMLGSAFRRFFQEPSSLE